MTGDLSGLGWEALRRQIDGKDVVAVQKAVSEAGPAERQAVAKQLPAYVRELPAEDALLDREEGHGYRRRTAAESVIPALAVAAIGGLDSASAVAAILTRAWVREQWYLLPTARMIEVAAARELPWLGELADRLAVRLPAPIRDPVLWLPLAELVVAGGGPVPTGERFVDGWVRSLYGPGWNGHDPESPAETLNRLRHSYFRDQLTPRLFELEGMGRLLRGRGEYQAPGSEQATQLLDAFIAVSAEGLLDRGLLLTGCVARLRLGDRRARCARSPTCTTGWPPRSTNWPNGPSTTPIWPRTHRPRSPASACSSCEPCRRPAGSIPTS